MNRFLYGWAAFLLCVCFSSALATEPSSWTVRVDVQMVAISPHRALTLIPKLQDERTADAAFADIQRMIERDDAELLAWPVAIARNRTRAVAESVVEVQYPTEAYPSYGGQSFSAEPEKPRPDAVPRFYWPRWGAIIPNTFETRNTGATLELEASVDEKGERIGLSIAPQFVQLIAFHEFTGSKSPAGIQGVLQRPEFSVSRTTCALTVANGRRILLSTSTETGPKKRLILYLLKAVARRP
ncbi:hypothetical protein ACXR0O_15750 [Verrucomicrobiota bacterium sgz303538]